MAESSLTYGGYLKVPELLSLQQCLSSPLQHDEPLFIVIHQVYELWFKLMLHETDTAIRHLGDDRVVEGTRLLRRVVEIQRLLVQQIRILETMRPQDFLGFRYHLMEQAQFLGVTGWVRNRRGGSVEAVIAGTADAVEELTAWARRGPAAASVERVDVGDTAGAFSSFELRPTE